MSENTLIQRSTNAVTTTILIEGEAIDSSVGIQSIIVGREVNKVAYATIILTDGDVATQDFPLSNEQLFKPGKMLTVQLGYQAEEETVFEGVILRHGIKARSGKPSILKLECHDLAVKMTVLPKSAYYTDITDSDLITGLIEYYGLEAEVEATTVEHKELIKYRVTDWDFMLLRAEANGQVVFVKDGKITVKAPDFSQDAKHTLTYGSTIQEFELEMDAERQFPLIEAHSWSFKDQESVIEESDLEEASQLGNLTTEELSAILFEDSKTLYHNGEMDADALKNWADADMLKSHLARTRGRIRLLGIADLYPGDVVELVGVGERFNGNALVTGVLHQVNNGLWTTDVQLGLAYEWFACKPKVAPMPAAGLASSIHGLHIGIVVQLEEEENKRGYSRCLVKIPHVKEVENSEGQGIWARLCNVFAGNETGMVFRPDIGDEVVLGFINDDPNHAIILGAVHSDDRPAPIEAKDDNYQKGLVTNGLMKLIFDDELKSVEVATDSGNSILLSEDEGGIIVTDENGNTFTLNSDGIEMKSAKDIIIEASNGVIIKGLTVDIEASNSLTAKGSATAEFSASGQTTLKGGVVMIN